MWEKSGMLESNGAEEHDELAPMIWAVVLGLSCLNHDNDSVTKLHEVLVSKYCLNSISIKKGPCVCEEQKNKDLIIS